MDIPHSNTTHVSTSSDARVSLSLQKTPTLNRAEVLEVVNLTKAQIRELVELKALAPELQKQLSNELLLQQNNQRLPKTEIGSTGESTNLVKLKILNSSELTLWALTKLDVKRNSLVQISRLGETLVLKGTIDRAAKEAYVSSPITTKNQTASSLSSLGAALPNQNPIAATAPLRDASKQPLNKAELSVLNQLLKLTLPIQDNKLKFLSELLPNLSNARPEILRLADRDNSALINRAANLLRQLDNWVKQMPSFQNLTPAKLQQSIQQSGVFMESSLKAFSANTPNTTLSKSPRGDAPHQQTPDDIKTLLISAVTLIKILTNSVNSATPAQSKGVLESIIKLLFQHRSTSNPKSSDTEHVRKMLATLEQSSNASLARVISNQSNALQQVQTGEVQPSLNLNTELLFRHNDQTVPIHISIRDETQEKDKSDTKKQKNQKTWLVFLEWSFAEFGAYNSEIKVVGSDVSARFWIENNHVEQRFRKNISKLQKSLEENGITVAKLSIEPQPLSVQNTHNTTSLIDVRT